MNIVGIGLRHIAYFCTSLIEQYCLRTILNDRMFELRSEDFQKWRMNHRANRIESHCRTGVQNWLWKYFWCINQKKRTEWCLGYHHKHFVHRYGDYGRLSKATYYLILELVNKCFWNHKDNSTELGIHRISASIVVDTSRLHCRKKFKSRTIPSATVWSNDWLLSTTSNWLSKTGSQLLRNVLQSDRRHLSILGLSTCLSITIIWRIPDHFA